MRKTLLFATLFLCVLAASAGAAPLPEVTFLQQQQTTGAPTITTLAPSSIGGSGPSFTLTVNGTNFINGDTVRWNGQARTTTFVNNTQLTAFIPATDIVASGQASVTVAHPGGTTSNAVTFTITTETTLYFAQIAEGKISTGAFKTKVIIINPNNKVVTATIDFFTDTGDPLAVDVGLGNLMSSLTNPIPAKSQLIISTAGTRSTASPGWARVKSADRIGGLVLYQFFNTSGAFVTEAGVASASLVTKFIIPADYSGSFEGALALVNPSDTLTMSATLRLLDSTGRELANATRLFGPRQHRAEFLREIFSASLIPAGFQGSVEIESSPGAPVAAVTLRTLSGLQTSSLPVVVEPEGQ